MWAGQSKSSIHYKAALGVPTSLHKEFCSEPRHTWLSEALNLCLLSSVDQCNYSYAAVAIKSLLPTANLISERGI